MSPRFEATDCENIFVPHALSEHTADLGEIRMNYATYPLVARTEEATNGLFAPGIDANPVTVADEILRILALPFGEKPLRSVIDFTGDGVEQANDHLTTVRNDFVRRMGFAELLTVTR